MVNKALKRRVYIVNLETQLRRTQPSHYLDGVNKEKKVVTKALPLSYPSSFLDAMQSDIPVRRLGAAQDGKSQGIGKGYEVQVW